MPRPSRKNPLLIYAIDVEGGQATLLVAPSGASLLVDAGWPTADGRDAQRIQAVMADAGIAKIDHLLVTHFHHDHVGGVPELAKRVPVGEFLDHGPNREDSQITRDDYAAYLAAIQGKPRRILHPGNTIVIPGLETIVLAADGEHIAAVPGIKPVPNPLCAAEPKWPSDDTENARSVGILVRFGKFRFLDLGDLTKAKEIALVCPANPIGTVDLYLATHHGFNLSNAQAIVDALHPRAAIMDNGAPQGGQPGGVADHPRQRWSRRPVAVAHRRGLGCRPQQPRRPDRQPRGLCRRRGLLQSRSLRRWQLFRDQHPHRPDQELWAHSSEGGDGGDNRMKAIQEHQLTNR